MASTYRMGQVAEHLGVSVDTVRRWSDEGRLSTVRTEGGHRLVEGGDLARFLRERADTFELDGMWPTSARNRFTGIVTRIERDRVAATVELQAGPHRIVSLMTAEAVDDLGLEPGDLAVAVVKATTVIVDTPPS